MTNSIKLDDYLKKFKEYLMYERAYSEYTLNSYLEDLTQFQNFLRKNGEFIGWDQVKTRDIERFLEKLGKEASRRTLQRKMSSLRSFYQFLVKRDLLKIDPTIAISIRAGEKKLPEFFYQNEVKKVIDSLNDSKPLTMRNKAIIELFYVTGMRRSELANLKLEQIDFDMRVILVHGKGRKDRYVPFTEESCVTLKNYLENSRPVLLKTNFDAGDVFLNNRGKKITERGIAQVMRDVFLKAGVSAKAHPHMLRHSFATQMLDNGADMRSVQELLGHESLSTTQIYTHISTKKLQSDYQKFFPRNNKENEAK
ncbi:tyrosine recombinase XerC [Lactobacillus sp. PV037]|uniref:tyrosine recombinase XerC n=1 Tax=unclassified Lactobacillus TaxID=2620435 RepID=UPI00223FF831|nr:MULTISPECIES: tyrosine recombinase XerC [unclassified Lactobacillus]QNQ82348.1 tyrosine recombinase XerC [Lactobacillus sp. PV012]QNQ83539.1 tyrosine recombinase XerC [Lactobacillus sp. PV037]